MHLTIVYLTSGVLAVLLLFLLFVIINRWKNKKSLEYPNYPSIVLTSHDSPIRKEEKLWESPDKASSNSKGTKSTSKIARESRQRSYWFPKRDIIPFLPPVKGEYLQPSLSKQGGDQIKGRLKFSFGYDYNMKLQRSILTVRLHHGRDYTDYFEDLPMDTFVKTRLLPSNKQTFSSKLQRKTLNPNYNESYYFDIEFSELKSQALCFEIFRLDCVSNNEIFGEVILPFKDVLSNGCEAIKEIAMSINVVDNANEISLTQKPSIIILNNDENVDEEEQEIMAMIAELKKESLKKK